MADPVRTRRADHLRGCGGLAGISLGGLLTCWALLTRPHAFTRYLAASPSLYWDAHLLLDERRTPTDVLRAAARTHSNLRAYLAVGEHEEAPHVQVGVDVIAKENHATIWPAAR